MIVNYVRVLMMKNYMAAATVAGLLLAGAVLSNRASAAAKPGNAAKGKDLFSQNCDVCHNSDSTETKVGPGLKGLFKKETLQK